MFEAERRSLRDGVILSILGTLLFLILAAVLKGLVGSPGEIVGCVVGIAATVTVAGTRGRFSFWSALPISTVIVLSVFVFIAIGHAAEDFLSGQSVGAEPVNLVFWAVVTTSWWLIPLTAACILVLNRFPKKEPEARADA